MRIVSAILIFNIGVLSAYASNYHAFYSGNMFYEKCSDGNQTICTTYVMGVYDAYKAMQDFSEIKENDQKTGICDPTSVTSQQLTDIALKYVKEHPESRHYIAARLIIIAIKIAFPCKGVE